MSDVKIYTTSACPFCFAAKQLFAANGTEFEEIRLDRDPELRQRLSAENNGWRTVPMIFINDDFVGGFQDVLKLQQTGKLEKMLSSEPQP